ncbi:MAG: hypothetical protein WC451_02345 [Patescibacteria group bacterium]
MEKPLFPFTPQIFRYLEDIIRLNDEELDDEADNWVTIQAYTTPEKPSVKLDAINLCFWGYLEEVGAIKESDDNTIVVGKSIDGEILKRPDGTRYFLFSKHKIKILDIDKIKMLLNDRKKQTIVKFNSLELIARDIGEMASGIKLTEFLKECGVLNEFIEYPNTKWRMVYAVLKTLSTSSKGEDRKILFRIIEEATHPLMHNGDEVLSKSIIKKFNGLLRYDKLFIDDLGILWQEVEEETWAMPEYINKDGQWLELDCNVIFPKDVEKLYVYWNELVKIVKFYFDNQILQDDGLNEIYFEIIQIVDDTLSANRCGGLKKKYKKPFNILVGCEYEKSQPTDKILASLYVFLGQITETSFPTEEGITEIKKGNDKLFKKIDSYIARYGVSKPEDQKTNNYEPLHVVIDEIKKEVPIRGFEEKIILQKPKHKKIQLRNFPKDLKWEEITIQFLNGQEVIIKYREKIHQTTYEEMGFQDGRKKLPNKQWEFLEGLSKTGGELSWKNSNASDKGKKHKQILRESLRAYFQIDNEEPFYDYKQENCYKLRIKLIPETDIETITKEQGIYENDDLGIEEYRKEQAPEINDG